MNKKTLKNSDPSRYHVPNLERALRILELLSEHHQGLTTTQITEKLNLPRNSVFRITATLLDNGYLIRDEETRVFQLSHKLLVMGYAGLSEQTLVEKSIGVMRQLRDRFKETVPLGILDGNEGLVIEVVQGTHSFRFVLEPGRRLHLHTSAPGKAMVAFLPADEQEQLIERIEFTRYNERTITDKNEYRSVLAQIRHNGYAVDQAEETEGMHCVGAPIFNRHNYPIAAIWITGPSSRIHVEEFAAIGRVIRNHADRISKSLGCCLGGEIK